MALKASILLNLSGNLQARARQMSGSLAQLGQRGSASMRLLSRGTAAVGRGLDRLGNRYTALLTGAAGVGAVRQAAKLEERFTRLGIQAGRSAGDMETLKKAIFETAKSPDIRVDPGDITSAVEEIIEKTGDLRFAEENIRNIGLAIQATGAEGSAIGGIMAEFQKMGLGAREAFEALDILTVQGKEGAFTLQNLAALGPRVVTAYTAMGRTGVPAIREMGAALQVIRQGTGSSEMAATAFEAVLRTLGDAQKVKQLTKAGIRIFEPGSTTQMRSIVEVMTEIVQKSKGSKMALSQVFDAEAIRAFNAAAGEFQRTGKVESLKKFYNVQADGGTITADSVRAARTFNAALQNLYTTWRQFADSQLSEPIKKLTAYLDGLKPGTVERWLEMGKTVAMIGGGAILAGKLFRGGMFVKNLFGRKGGAAGAGGLGGLGGPVPVYVVNRQMSLLNDGSGFGAGSRGAAGAAKGQAATLRGLARRGSTGLLGSGRGLSALSTGITVGAAGAGTTALAASAAGLAGYGVGTLLNRVLGALSGLITGGQYSGKGWLGEMIYDALHGAPDKPAEVGGTIKLKIEGAPVRVEELRSNNRQVDYEVDTGRTGAGGSW